MHVERLSPSLRWNVCYPAQFLPACSFLRPLRHESSREEACSRAEILRFKWEDPPPLDSPGFCIYSARTSARRAAFNPHCGRGVIMATKRLTLQQRRVIFRDLVATQDLGTGVRRSYQIVTERFEITDAQLRQIEDEGLEKEWPPLNEAMQEVG